MVSLVVALARGRPRTARGSGQLARRGSSAGCSRRSLPLRCSRSKTTSTSNAGLVIITERCERNEARPVSSRTTISPWMTRERSEIEASPRANGLAGRGAGTWEASNCAWIRAATATVAGRWGSPNPHSGTVLERASCVGMTLRIDLSFWALKRLGLNGCRRSRMRPLRSWRGRGRDAERVSAAGQQKRRMTARAWAGPSQRSEQHERRDVQRRIRELAAMLPTTDRWPGNGTLVAVRVSR